MGNGGSLPVLAFVVSSGYLPVMKHVRIADLKSHLSAYLRHVRGGRTLTVLDRHTPIAQIVPCGEQNALLSVRAPLPGAPKLHQVPLPPPLKLETDIVSLLLQERESEP